MVLLALVCCALAASNAKLDASARMARKLQARPDYSIPQGKCKGVDDSVKSCVDTHLVACCGGESGMCDGWYGKFHCFEGTYTGCCPKSALG